jgi:hypothetical protein
VTAAPVPRPHSHRRPGRPARLAAAATRAPIQLWQAAGLITAGALSTAAALTFPLPAAAALMLATAGLVTGASAGEWACGRAARARARRTLARFRRTDPFGAVAPQEPITEALAALHHEPPRVPAWEPVPPHTGPLPAALETDPPADEFPHLRRAWADDTGTLTKLIIEGEER